MEKLIGFKAKTIYEIAYLKMKGIPVVREIQYERKRVLFFKDDLKESTNAIKEFYNSGFNTYAESIQEVRNYMFEKLNENKLKG